MNIIIAGGTGFIGQALVKHFLKKGYTLTVIGRSRNKIKTIFKESVSPITWDEFSQKGLALFKSADIVINLTGAGIGDARWTQKRKKEILDSRIIPTETISELCAKLGPENSPVLLNASAVGIYGLQPTLSSGLPKPLDENEPIDYHSAPDFLSKVGRAWELATQSASQAGVRVVKMRFGVVLGKGGGVLAKLKWPFLFFIGGPQGSGKQPFSWIALPDLIDAIDFLILHSDIKGPVNLVSPQTITQREFAKAIGKALHRPSFMTTPAFLLKWTFGEMAEELLLRGQHVKPSMLLQHQFLFHFPSIDAALENIKRDV